jgi:uncharacterized membrane protein YecN with MAPEG domain
MPIPTVTPIYAALAAFLMVALMFRVIALRVRGGVGLGDGGDGRLLAAIRIHANFAEHVPLALLLVLLVELQGWGGGRVHALGAVLIVARLLHVWGLTRSAGASPGRFAGTVGTVGVILTAAVLVLLRAAGLA